WPADGGDPLTDNRTFAEIVDEKVERRIAEHIKRRQLDESTLPADAANMAGLVQTLLHQCVNTPHGYTIQSVAPPRKHQGKQPTYQAVVHEKSPTGSDVST